MPKIYDAIQDLLHIRKSYTLQQFSKIDSLPITLKAYVQTLLSLIKTKLNLNFISSVPLYEKTLPSDFGYNAIIMF